jgi:hypothetical protein
MESTKEIANMDNCISIEEDELFNCANLTDFYSEEPSEQDQELKQKIEHQKWFYLKNQKYDYISLKKNVFDRFKEDKHFIGNIFINNFEKEEDMVILLTQFVNEKKEMKKLGKTLFYRELYLSTCKNKSVNQLFKKYIGEVEQVFIFECKRLVDYYRWSFLVHRNRLIFIKDRINNLLIESDNLNLKSIKNYDDVFNYFKNKSN